MPPFASATSALRSSASEKNRRERVEQLVALSGIDAVVGEGEEPRRPAGMVDRLWRIGGVEVDDRDVHVLQRTLAAVHPSLFVGCPMWAHRPWVGRWLPGDTASGRELEPYSRYVNAVEGNTTFYASPTPATVVRWLEQADAGLPIRVQGAPGDHPRSPAA